MKKAFLVNIHIPKCGGSTFRNIIKKNLHSKFNTSYGFIWREFYRKDQIREFILTHHQFSAFSSHEISLDLPFEDDNINLFSTISLRDPLQRVCSHYFFERQRKLGIKKFADTQKLTLNQFIETILSHDDHWLINYQTKHLIRNTGFNKAEDIIELCNRFSIQLIVLERFFESMLVLERNLPQFFTDCAYVPTNASRHTESPNKDLALKFKKRNAEDELLLEYANKKLDEQLSPENFNNRESHKVCLSKRCAKLKRWNSVKKKLKWPIQRVKKVLQK